MKIKKLLACALIGATAITGVAGLAGCEKTVEEVKEQVQVQQTVSEENIIARFTYEQAFENFYHCREEEFNRTISVTKFVDSVPSDAMTVTNYYDGTNLYSSHKSNDNSWAGFSCATSDYARTWERMSKSGEGEWGDYTASASFGGSTFVESEMDDYVIAIPFDGIFEGQKFVCKINSIYDDNLGGKILILSFNVYDVATGDLITNGNATVTIDSMNRFEKTDYTYQLAGTTHRTVSEFTYGNGTTAEMQSLISTLESKRS